MASVLKVDTIQHTDGSTAVTGKVNDSRQCVMGFMLTSGVSGDQNPITGWANMATQLSGDGAGKITRGGSVTESSGTFSFPITGLWQIEFFASLNSSGTDGTIQYNMKTTTDDSSYSSLLQAKESAGGSNYKAFAGMKGLFNVTNTSTHKVRLQQTSFSSHTSEGSTTEALTYVIFTWLGDAD